MAPWTEQEQVANFVIICETEAVTEDGASLARCRAQSGHEIGTFAVPAEQPLGDLLYSATLQHLGPRRFDPRRISLESSAGAALRQETSAERVDRVVVSLLDALPQDGVDIVLHRLSQLELSASAEVNTALRLIVGRACKGQGHHDVYGAMAAAVQTSYSEPPLDAQGSKKRFKKCLLDVLQDEFEGLSARSPQDDLRLLMFLKFLAVLSTQQILPWQAVVMIAMDVLAAKDGVAPEACRLEGVVDLLATVGHLLDESPKGKMAVTQLIERLKSLQQLRNGNGRPLYGDRMGFLVQWVQQLRLHHWSVASTADHLEMCVQERAAARL